MTLPLRAGSWKSVRIAAQSVAQKIGLEMFA